MKKLIIFLLLSVTIFSSLVLSANAAVSLRTDISSEPNTYVIGTQFPVILHSITIEYNGEIYVNIYKGTGAKKTLLSSQLIVINNFGKSHTLIGQVLFFVEDYVYYWDTSGYAPGTYTIEYYSTFLNSNPLGWVECGDRDSFTVTLVKNTCNGKHKWNSGTVTIAPTCTVSGRKTQTCTVCGMQQYVSVPAAHKWNSGIVTTKATCAKPGVKTYTCSVCGRTKNESIPKTTTHSWDSGIITSYPTCTEDGQRQYTCKICRIKKYSIVPATGHSYQLFQTIDEPIEHYHGKGIFRCSNCGIQKTAEICPSSQFTDVGSYKNWAHESIDFCVKNGLLSGTSATTFSRDDKMSRAMLVTVLWRVSGSPAPVSSNPFSDVKKKGGSWYYDAVLWAAENNIVSGTSVDKFDPNGNVTREQIASILYRYTDIVLNKIDPEKACSLSSYPDEKAVSKWAITSLSWATAEGLITGAKVGTETLLNPKGDATRAEVAAILMRYMNNIYSTDSSN